MELQLHRLYNQEAEDGNHLQRPGGSRKVVEMTPLQRRMMRRITLDAMVNGTDAEVDAQDDRRAKLKSVEERSTQLVFKEAGKRISPKSQHKRKSSGTGK